MRISIHQIYNSRNYSILLNEEVDTNDIQSTTVEIILYYLTFNPCDYKSHIYNSRNYSILLNATCVAAIAISTTVEIILYYLTGGLCSNGTYLQQ